MGPSVSVSTHPEGRNVTPVIRLRVNAGYRLEFAFRTCPSGMPGIGKALRSKNGWCWQASWPT